jgi:hypothetical protein
VPGLVFVSVRAVSVPKVPLCVSVLPANTSIVKLPYNVFAGTARLIEDSLKIELDE